MIKLDGKEKVYEYTTQVSCKPLLSICVQTYNHDKYISKCLDGILEQKTNFEFEILLGEDNSTDDTRQICKEYADRFPKKIKLFLHHKNNVIFFDGSPSGRYNFIYNLQKANGKFIALCEGDDYWTDPLKLQKQVDFLENNPDHAICFHDTRILENEKFKKDWNEPFLKETSDIYDLVQNNFIHTNSIVFRAQGKDFLPDWFSHVVLGDFALFMLLAQTGKIHHIDEFMSVYRIHKGGVWSQKKKVQRDKTRCEQMFIMADNFDDERIREVLMEKGINFMRSSATTLSDDPFALRVFFDKIKDSTINLDLKRRLTNEIIALLHEQVENPSLSYLTKRISVFGLIKFFLLKLLFLIKIRQ